MRLSKMLPIGGFAIAVALVGITSAFKDAPKTNSSADTYSFEYQPPSTDPYIEANVENEANWVYNEDASGCDGDARACTLLDVPEDFVDASGSQPILKTNINIVAVQTGTDAKVTSTASSATISNQDN